MEIMGKVVNINESSDVNLYFPTIEFFDGTRVIKKRVLSGIDKKYLKGIR